MTDNNTAATTRHRRFPWPAPLRHRHTRLLLPLAILAIAVSCATQPDPHGGITIAPLKEKPVVTTFRHAIPPEIPGLKDKAANYDLVDITDIDNTILVDLRYNRSR